ncbi:MAG: primosomal protein N' [Deltaproteobacteria bacterium]|nr:MAG: primosomal protein N' [Deltaproteobacteria bacterium]
MQRLVEIAPIPPVPLHDLLTYGVPDALHDLAPGMRVRIPLGRQARVGVVAGFAVTPPPGQLRSVLEVLDREPFLPAELLELCRWTARYYLVSLAEVIATIVPRTLPPRLSERVVRLVRRLDDDAGRALARRAPARAHAYRTLLAAENGELVEAAARSAGIPATALRGLVAAGLAETIVREPCPAVPHDERSADRPLLTSAQRSAVEALGMALGQGTSASFVLLGVTGSGKTEVFLAAAEHALAGGRDVVLLVPEIALTHQIVERVRARFGGAVAVLHSGLGLRERWTEWRRIRSREARVVVGARSAVFAPVERLGLLVVDEEHDPAYKQEEGLRYNARDLAVVRARLAGAVVVLASATPSAESYHAARTGRHLLLELPERPTAHALPSVELVDLRRRVHSGASSRLFSDELRAALEENLATGGQTLVFLNRRGFATYLQCAACGTALTCPQCSVTLTLHRAAAALVCHHCHHHRRVPPACAACGGGLEAFGVGTEQIESALRACYPLAAVDRLDRDAAQRVGAQRRILHAWRAGDTDILPRSPESRRRRTSRLRRFHGRRARTTPRARLPSLRAPRQRPGGRARWLRGGAGSVRPRRAAPPPGARSRSRRPGRARSRAAAARAAARPLPVAMPASQRGCARAAHARTRGPRRRRDDAPSASPARN